MNTLKGKVALVTGSSRGIGAAIAIALAREGADVIINYVSASSKTRAEEVVKEVEGFGSRSLLVQANLESLEEVEALVQAGVTKFGKIDILVNNGGVSDMQSVDQITPENFSRQFNINVRAAIFLSKGVIPHMGNGGRIINITSVAARQGNPNTTVFSATKAALEAVTRVMGVELRDKGITVNSMNPGPTQTDAWDRLAGVRDKFPNAKLVAQPEDIADMVALIAGPKSRWVTGSTISTNNGIILN